MITTISNKPLTLGNIVEAMEANYIEILSDDDDDPPQQPAANLVDLGSDAYILIEDEVQMVDNVGKVKQKAADGNE